MDATQHRAGMARVYLEQLPDSMLRRLVEGLKRMLARDYKPEWEKHGICSNLAHYLERFGIDRSAGYDAVCYLAPLWESFNGCKVNPIPLEIRDSFSSWHAPKWEGRQRRLRVSLMEHMLGLYRREQERRRKGTRKWEKPGAYQITSYRSFRRYKAAGARFEERTGSAQTYLFHELDIDTARRRAQAHDITGVSCLWAVVE